LGSPGKVLFQGNLWGHFKANLGKGFPEMVKEALRGNARIGGSSITICGNLGQTLVKDNQ